MQEYRKAYRFRIYPSDEQKEYFEKHFDGCRKFYNLLVRTDREYYAIHGRYNSNLCLKDCREMLPELAELDGNAIYTTGKHYIEALDKHVSDRNKVKRPAYKRRPTKTSERYTTSVTKFNIEVLRNGHPLTKVQDKNGNWVVRKYLFDTVEKYNDEIARQGLSKWEYFLKLPKGALIPMVVHRPIPDGHILSKVTIIKELSGEYFAVLTYKYNDNIELVEPKKIIGLDYSLATGFVDSDGRDGQYPHFAKAQKDKLARLKKKLARADKAGRNAEKIRIQIARVHTKIRNQRSNYQHQIAKKYADENDVVIVETLSVSDIQKKAYFREASHDISFPSLLNCLEQKLNERGKRLVKADRKFKSTLTCSCCGNVKDEMPTNVRIYRCKVCGSKIHRDVNAAINLRNKGSEMLLTTDQSQERKKLSRRLKTT